MQKKILTLIFTLCVLLCTLAFTVTVGAIPDVGLTQDADGAYLIEDVDDLKILQSKATVANTQGNTYKVTGDIVATGFTGIPNFAGTFDGGNNTITLSISNAGNAGLFKIAGSDASGVVPVIKNVIVDGTVTCTAADKDAAGLVAIAMSNLSIENCINNATVVGTGKNDTNGTGGILGRYRNEKAYGSLTIDGCTNNGAISATSVQVGGIAGICISNNANVSGGTVLIQNCKNTGTVNTTAAAGQAKLGGIIGIWRVRVGTNMTFTVSGCENTGTIGDGAARNNVGGILGYIYAQTTQKATVNIIDCVNAGTLNSTGEQVGGICALVLIQGTTAAKNVSVTFTDCSNTSDITGGTNVGGIVGFMWINAAAVTGCEVEISGGSNDGGIVANTNYAGGAIGAVRYSSASNSNSFTVTGGFVNSGDVTATGSNAGGIVGCAITAGTSASNSVSVSGANSGVISADNYAGGAIGHIDSDSTGAGNTASVSNFTNSGTVTATKNNAGGVVGYCSATVAATTKITIGGDVKNTSTGTVTGQINVGGIIGCFYQDPGTDGVGAGMSLTVTGCTNEGAVKSSNPSPDSTGYADARAGGIVGYITVQNCTSASVSISSCENKGTICNDTAKRKNAGGIVGYIYFDDGGSTTEITLDFNNCTNNGIVNINGPQAGGIVATLLFQNDTTSALNTDVTFDGCINANAVTGVDNIGGIVGYLRVRNDSKECSVTVTGGSNSGDITAKEKNAGGAFGIVELSSSNTTVDNNSVMVNGFANTGEIAAEDSIDPEAAGGVAGGVAGYIVFDGTASSNTVTITGCSNTGKVASNSNYAGGIAGFVFYNKGSQNVNNTVTIEKSTNGGDISGTIYVGGIVGYLNIQGGAGTVASITECTNTADAAITATSEVGGILGRFNRQNLYSPTDVTVNTAKFTFAKCKNLGSVTADKNGSSESRAGGLIGIYYQQITSNFETEISQCWNDGAVSGTGANIGGLVGMFLTKIEDADTVKNCINTGAVSSSAASPRLGGLIGESDHSSYSSQSYKLVNVYHNGTIDAPNATEKVGYIIGNKPAAISQKNVYYNPQDGLTTSVKLQHEKEAAPMATDTVFTSVTDTDGTPVWTLGERNGLELKIFHVCNDAHTKMLYNESAATLTVVCESVNCESTDDPFGTVHAVLTTIYVKDGGAASNATLGSRDNPFASLGAARDYLLMIEPYVTAAKTIYIMGEVEVPADFEIPAATVTGEGENGVLYFANKTPIYNRYQLYIGGEVTIKELTIATKDNKGLHIYAHSNPLEMGTGLTMVDKNGDYYDIIDNGIDATEGMGARVFIFGGHNISKHLAEELEGQEITSETVNAIIIEEETNSNITVRSGEYRHVGGWNYDFFCYDENRREIKYYQPVTGTVKLTIGKKDPSDTLKITAIGPFGCDYESFGEGRVADITIDGDVNVFQFHFGSHLKAMTDGALGSGNTIGEYRNPLTLNLYLDGNIMGYDGLDLEKNPWGFDASAAAEIAILANISVNPDNEDAILDAHAFLGHDDSFCDATDKMYLKDTSYNYANRSIIYLETCDCPTPVESATYGEPLLPTCISYGLNRIMCEECGRFIRSETMLENGEKYLDPTYHSAYTKITAFGSMEAFENGVRLGDGTAAACCNNAADPIIGEGGVFYVSMNGNDRFVPGLGTEAEPIKDFVTALKLATAYAEGEGNVNGGRTAIIKIMDYAEWQLGATPDTYTTTPNRKFDVTYHQPGEVIIESADPANKAEFHFVNTNQWEKQRIRLCIALTMQDLELTFENHRYTNPKTGVSGPARVWIQARGNKLVMGKGLEIATNYSANDGTGKLAFERDNSYHNNLVIIGGFDGNPSVAMDTDVTVLSGDYYYIGAWNQTFLGSSSNVVTGEGKLTIGYPGSTEQITTGYLSLYGVGPETTGDAVVDLHIYSSVDVYTFEPTAQNGYKSPSDPGANTVETRVSNIYLHDGANLTLNTVHENTNYLRGTYEVNVYVKNPSANASLEAVHAICGHDKGIVTGQGKINGQHINAYHPICDEATCPFASAARSSTAAVSKKGSYLFPNGYNTDVTDAELFASGDSTIYVNVYDMDKEIVVVGDWVTGFDSGYYRGENDEKLGVARFLYDAVFGAGTDLAGMVEESGVLFVFDGDAVPDVKNIVGDKGVKSTFYADIIQIPENYEEPLYAVGYLKISGKYYYSHFAANGEELPVVRFDRFVEVK